MTKMTANQATSGSGPHSGLVDRTYIVSRKALNVDGVMRQVGELIPEVADWSYKLRNIYLNQGLIQEVALVTDDAREAFQRQWGTERQARFEAAQLAAQAPKPEPVPVPTPPPTLTFRCANCKAANTFDHEVGNDEWWQCSQCGQRQTGEQSQKGTLQIIQLKAGSHAVGHNWKPPTWRPE